MVSAAASANARLSKAVRGKFASEDYADPRNMPPALARALAPLFAVHLDARLTREMVCVAGCDAIGRLIAFTEQCGDVAHVASALPAVRHVLGHIAVTQIVIAHNHISGCPVPSAADRMSTRQIAALVQAAGASLIDHLLFTADEVVSFHALGAL